MKGQGGFLGIESAPGVGTTVTVGFPHVVPKALVVEDSKFDMELASILLKNIGIKVIGAGDGEEAFRLGAADFIKKTLQAEALVARVRRIVS